jgi:hypothetical protein
VLQAESEGHLMMAAADLARLYHDDYRAWFYRQRAELAALDRLIVAKDAAEQWDPIADLAALGVQRSAIAWELGVLATRLWLLELAQRADEYQLWRYIAMTAQCVVAKRHGRKFGVPAMTLADLEQARLELEISNEHWLRVRATASWALRGLGGDA